MNFQFNNFQKILFTLIIFCGIFGVAGSSLAAEPATYYVDDNACSDNYAGTSSDQPLCTFAEAMTKLQAGDTLLIKDGTYNQSLNATVSGTQVNEITIKAVNDGQAIVDGQNVRIPLSISGVSYVTVNGIVFKNSNRSTIYVNAGSSHITLKRVSGYNAGSDNTSIFEISHSSHVLLEDCVASGNARKMFLLYWTDHSTLRRCWGRWTGFNGTGGSAGSIVNIYDAGDNLIENCIGLQDTSVRTLPITGIGLIAQSNYTSINNKFYGNVAYDLPDAAAFKDEGNTSGVQISGNQFINNVAINSYNGLNVINDMSHVSQNNTIISSTDNNANCSSSNGGSAICTIKNVSFSSGGSGLYSTGSVSSTYNNFYGLSRNVGGTAMQGTGDKTLNPSYNTVTYGNGAYLMVPSALKGKGENGADIGAQVLYRYVDGVLTSTPLWPWPMEERIKNELNGISVTYESGGGIWKTLCGVYGEGAGCNDPTPPAAPSGLSVQ